MAHFIDLSREPFDGDKGTAFLIQWIIDHDVQFVTDFKGGRASDRIDAALKKVASTKDRWLKVEQDEDFRRLVTAADTPRFPNGAAGYPAHPRKILGHLKDIMEASEANPAGEE